MKNAIKAVMYITLSAGILIVLLGFNIFCFGQNTRPVRSDSIIILGCSVYGAVPSPFLKARLDEGLRLYKEGYAKFIIVSGGKGRGESVSEAAAMKKYLEEKGVDAESIIVEDKSLSTLENLTFQKQRWGNMD